jgi:hypothetical protein
VVTDQLVPTDYARIELSIFLGIAEINEVPVVHRRVDYATSLFGRLDEIKERLPG